MKNNYFNFKTFYPVLGLLILVFIVNSCTKDKTNNGSGVTYEMSFMANGTKVVYTLEAALVATFAEEGDQYLGTFVGYDSDSNMDIEVFDSQAISKKEYSGYTTSGTILVGVLMSYDDSTGTLYSQAGDDVVVTITSIAYASISGTFSGTLKASGKPDMVITDGKFTVKRIN